MAVTVEYRMDGSWSVSSLCRTKAEAFAKAAKIEEVRAEAFIPVEPAAHHAVEAPMPPHLAEDSPVHAAMQWLIEGDDEPGSLKAGEAYRQLGSDAE